MPCIFCPTESELTEEHVFPAFCGGVLTVPDASCLRCNRDKSSKFETEIARLTGNMRHVLNVGNRYDKVPSSRVTFGLEDLTIDAMLRPDGEIDLHNVVLEPEKLEDGRTRTRAFFTTPEAAEKWSEKARKRGHKVTDISLGREIVIEPVSQQTLQFAFTLAMKQLVAKTALVAVAYRYGIDYALKRQFDKLRERIFLPNVPVRVFSNEKFAANQLRTPRQHSVITHLSAGLHHGWSLVTLFGGVSYFVHLTAEFDERESRSFSIHYDIETKQEFNPIVLLNEWDLIRRVMSDETRFESLEGLDRQWYAIIEADCKAKGLHVFKTTSIPEPETRNPEP